MIWIVASADRDRDLVDLRNRLAIERNRLAEMRQQVKTLKERGIRDRLNAADLADLVADQAESCAALLEGMAVGEARDRRLKLAQREREIAAVERRNAARLRQAGAGPMHLERPPPLNDDAESPRHH